MSDRGMWDMRGDRRKRALSRRWYWVHKYKMSKGCSYCNLVPEDPVGLCFAHMDPMTKHPLIVNRPRGNGIGVLVNRITIKDPVKNRRYIKELFDEIKKCIVLCITCHTIQGKRNKEWERGYAISRERKTGIKCIELTEEQVEIFA